MTNRILWLFIATIPLIFTGCNEQRYSVHPCFLPEQIVQDENLEGEWEGAWGAVRTNVALISQEKGYRLSPVIDNDIDAEFLTFFN